MDVTFADLAAPKAVETAAHIVLEKMVEDPSMDEQIVIHDVINEEILTSDIAVSPTQFEAVRMAVFLRYSALRAEASLDDEGCDDNEHDDENGEER